METLFKQMYDFTYTLAQIVGVYEHNELVDITCDMTFEEAMEKYRIPNTKIWTEEKLAEIGESCSPSFEAEFKHIKTTIFKTPEGGCEVLEDYAEVCVGNHSISVNFSS